MHDHNRILELVESVIDSDRTPDEVCRDHPEMLEAVRARVRRFRETQAQFEELFPSSRGMPSDLVGALSVLERLPSIPNYAVHSVLGRGGSGVVYAATHLQLSRPVAIKMLLSGPFAGPGELARFVREARAIAQLCHPNIVHIHDVGEVDGRPFYTMEVIEGGSLAQRLGGHPMPADEAAGLIAVLARAIHASHDVGLVHRDLKPGNVLFTRDGAPKITDFGLARQVRDGAEDSVLTVAGARLGTPSYMSPEQAMGSVQEVGPASDVYSLGAMLYEMLTGRPPFRGESTAETERQVIRDEPVAPSRLNPRVPRDLETICLKCLAKVPARRYGAALELALDAERFVQGRPIAARPVGAGERAVKWVRRNPVPTTVAACAVVLLGAGVYVGAWWVSSRAAVTALVRGDLVAVGEAQARGDWSMAAVALDRARARLGGVASGAARREIEAAQVSLDLVERLDVIRLSRTRLGPYRFDDRAMRAEAASKYEAVFAEVFGVTKESSVEEVAARVVSSPIRAAVVAALDDWAGCVGFSSDADVKARLAWVLEVARTADPDATGWRDAVREPETWLERTVLEKLAGEAPTEGESIPLLVALSERLHYSGGDAGAFLGAVQRRHPDDFWVTFNLSNVARRTDMLQSVRYLQAALALRPESAIVHNNLGCSLGSLGRLDEAAAHLRRAIEIDPESSTAHSNMGNALQLLGRFDEALAEYAEAIRLDPESSNAHGNLGKALMGVGRTDEAMEMYERAIALDPVYAAVRDNYGYVLHEAGRYDDAIASLREAIRLDAKVVTAHLNLGRSLRAVGEHRESVEASERAIALNPGVPEAYLNLSLARFELGELEAALDAADRGLAVKPEYLKLYAARCRVLLDLGRVGDARADARRIAEGSAAGSGMAGEAQRVVEFCDGLLARESRLERIADGSDKEASALDLVLAGHLLMKRKRNAEAVACFARAFEMDGALAEDNTDANRLTASRAAMIAGAVGSEGDSPARERLRKQALAWLREDLAMVTGKVDLSERENRASTNERYTRWCVSPDFASIREAESLARLGEAERGEWMRLWADVHELLDRVRSRQ